MAGTILPFALFCSFMGPPNARIARHLCASVDCTYAGSCSRRRAFGVAHRRAKRVALSWWSNYFIRKEMEGLIEINRRGAFWGKTRVRVRSREGPMPKRTA